VFLGFDLALSSKILHAVAHGLAVSCWPSCLGLCRDGHKRSCAKVQFIGKKILEVTDKRVYRIYQKISRSKIKQNNT
jgi:hypothetical protein